MGFLKGISLGNFCLLIRCRRRGTSMPWVFCWYFTGILLVFYWYLFSILRGVASTWKNSSSVVRWNCTNIYIVFTWQNTPQLPRQTAWLHLYEWKSESGRANMRIPCNCLRCIKEQFQLHKLNILCTLREISFISTALSIILPKSRVSYSRKQSVNVAKLAYFWSLNKMSANTGWQTGKSINENWFGKFMQNCSCL